MFQFTKVKVNGVNRCETAAGGWMNFQNNNVTTVGLQGRLMKSSTWFKATTSYVCLLTDSYSDQFQWELIIENNVYSGIFSGMK